LGKDNDLTDVSSIVKKLQQQRDQYDLMERRVLYRKENLKKKIPEITKTLSAVELLKRKREEDEPVKTHFLVSENVYMGATVKKTDTVALWLGADVMVEYSFDEAIELLNKNLEMAKQMLDEVTEDLAFIKDQKTTTEVNISRVHNFGVKMRAKARASQKQ
jgi:prefoldin subunit 5